MYTEEEKENEKKYLDNLIKQLANDIDFLKNEINFLGSYIKLDKEKINEKMKECIKELEKCTVK